MQTFKHQILNRHLHFGRTMNQLEAQRDGIFFFLFSFSVLTLNAQSQPSCHDDPVRAACFLKLQSTQKPSCYDLPAIAAPCQVAAFLWEPFQIKTFSQQSLKSWRRQALNKRTHFLPVSSQALRQTQPCVAHQFVVMSVLPNTRRWQD